MPAARPKTPAKPKVPAQSKPKARTKAKAPAKSSAKSPRIAAAHRTSADALEAQKQLHALAAALEETARAYVARLRREIEEVADLLPARAGKPVAKVNELLGGFHVKAHKGRRKDLKKIDRLIGELQDLVGG